METFALTPTLGPVTPSVSTTRKNEIESSAVERAATINSPGKIRRGRRSPSGKSMDRAERGIKEEEEKKGRKERERERRKGKRSYAKTFPPSLPRGLSSFSSPRVAVFLPLELFVARKVRVFCGGPLAVHSSDGEKRFLAEVGKSIRASDS